MNDNCTEWVQIKIGDFLIEHSDKSSLSNQYEVLSVTKEGILSQKEYQQFTYLIEKDPCYHCLFPTVYVVYVKMSVDLPLRWIYTMMRIKET